MVRAIVVNRFGGPEVLRLAELPDPEPEPGQVMIEVEAAGVCWGNTIVRSGTYPLALPFIPGWEVGGRIAAVGPGVDPALVGRRVAAQTTGNTGGYAELAAVDAAAAVEVPPPLSVQDAVALFLPGQTATALMEIAAPVAGRSILVTSAAGANGSLLVQMAAAQGARTIIGAAGGARKTALVSGLGADVAVDYGEPGWGRLALSRAGLDGVDIVIDCVGGSIGRQAFDLVSRARGRLIVYGTTSGAGISLETREIAQRGIVVVGGLGILAARSSEELRSLARDALLQAARGALRPPAVSTYPLAKAAEAHADLEARRTNGKLILVP